MAAVAQHRVQIDELDLASRRPCPFSTFEYLETFLQQEEPGDRAQGEELLFLAAFDAERLVGYLPLRKFRQRMLGVPFGRVGMVVSHDTDRPHVIARAEDETRCCQAMVEHLTCHEEGWSFLEFVTQDQASGLSVLPRLNPLRYYVRRFENAPNTTVPLSFASLDAYFGSLSRSHRRVVQRHCRRLLSAGKVEIVRCADPRGREAMLEAYLDVERRSWKQTARVGIGRSPQRLNFFKALASPTQPLELAFDFVLIDDLPIAGLVSGAYSGGLHGLETAFDQSYEDLGPGHLLSLMAIERGIELRCHSFNFDGNYSYYKEQMGGVVTPTWAIQVFRVGSPPWARAWAGALKRRILPSNGQLARFNPERRRAAQAAREDESAQGPPSAPIERPACSAERAHTRSTLAALEAAGVQLDRVSGAALERRLPFPLGGAGRAISASAGRLPSDRRLGTEASR